ncbi:hypothetical protein LSAT2_031940 [Lamellibrachia satsuma]|nr:hypothetical protein LSAT2_031940 [Lamellibrachia satsuma]
MAWSPLQRELHRGTPQAQWHQELPRQESPPPLLVPIQTPWVRYPIRFHQAFIVWALPVTLDGLNGPLGELTLHSLHSVSDKTHKFVDIKHFDTYSEDSPLIRYLKLGIKDTHLILAATQDEASMSLKEDAKSMMHFYGSSAVDKLGFRDSLVMIGQRGLTHGSAMEKLVTREPAHEFAGTAELKGCLSLPIGKLNTEPLKIASQDVPKDAAASMVKVGQELDKCGVKDNCGTTAFPVHLYTGKGNSEGPKICVSGK